METEWIVEIDGDPKPTVYVTLSEVKAREIYDSIEAISGWGARLYSRQVSPKTLVERK